jgi:hypothetical protein
MKKEKCDILEANRRLDILPEDKLKNALKPENLLKTGFTLNDIID